MKHRREILAIAVPAIVSNITTPILSLVDVAITGHIGNAVYIGAIALGGTVFNTLYWLFNFLRMGTSGLTAQAYGANDKPRRSLILYRSLAVGVILGILLLLLSCPLGHLAIGFMDPDEDTGALALRYFDICILGAPAVMLTYALSGWFLGMQNSRAQMWMAIITNIINIAVSPLLVFGLGWKIEGVATGTVTAQYVGLTVGAYIVYRKYRPPFPGIRKIIEPDALLAFFRINGDIFLRTACLVAVTLWFTHAGALQGTDILAANALLLQLFMLFSYFMDGFAFAAEALAGKYFGSSDNESLRSLVRTLMGVGLSLAVIFSIIYGALGETILRLLAEDPSVIVVARRYLPWAVAIPLCGFLAFLWDGIFVGLVRTRSMLAAMSIAIATFFALYFILRGSLGNNALWIAFNAYLLLRGLVSALIGKSFWLIKH